MSRFFMENTLITTYFNKLHVLWKNWRSLQTRHEVSKPILKDLSCLCLGLEIIWEGLDISTD